MPRGLICVLGIFDNSEPILCSVGTSFARDKRRSISDQGTVKENWLTKLYDLAIDGPSLVHPEPERQHGWKDDVHNAHLHKYIFSLCRSRSK